jgi:predicted nuclease of predicted toxin-antitoxin system
MASQTTDIAIWDYAKQHDFIIVTKDKDYRGFSIWYGSPPKVVLIGTGNCSTRYVADLLKAHFNDIQYLATNPCKDILEII